MPYVCAADVGMEARSPGEALGIPRQHGFVDFTNPDAFAWWRDAHEKLFADGVDVVMTDGGERVPDDAFAFNGDTGRRLHNVYPLLYSQCVHDATARFARENDASPISLCARRLGRQPALSDRVGRRAAKRLGRARGVDPRRIVVGHERRARSTPPQSAAPYGPPPPAELWLRWLQACRVRVAPAPARRRRLPAVGLRRRRPRRSPGSGSRSGIACCPYLQRTIGAATQTGLPVMRAMALAFPGNALVRGYETQFMCGDALLVAPIVAPGGEVEVALPPGAWYDLNSRQRFPGLRVLRYRAALDQFPVFGREGHALPLGPAVQHTGEIDPAAPARRVVGVRARRRRRSPVSRRCRSARAPARQWSIDAAPDLAVEWFGDARARSPPRGATARPAPAADDADRRAIAITVGEPAGIGPELIAMLAERHRERPFAARLVVIGDIDLLAARAARAGIAASYRRYDPAATAPAARRRRSLAPAAVGAGDRRAGPIPPTRGRCSRCSTAPPMPAPPARSRRSSPRRCRRAC